MKLGVPVFAFVLSAPTYAATEDQRFLKELSRAEATWSARAPVNMTYVIRRGGVFGGSTYKITIRGDRCRAIARHTSAKRDAVWRNASCDGVRVADIFKDLRNDLTRGTSGTTVKFNAKYGYIESLSVEPDVDLTDQGWFVTMLRFTEDRR